MLSIVPLINGGGLFETGAGGSAPKPRAAASEGELPALGQLGGIPRACRQLRAPGTQYEQRAAPRFLRTRSTGRPAHSSKRTSRLLAVWVVSTIAVATSIWRLYWAQELAQQTDDAQLADAFVRLAKTLSEQEQAIVDELIAVQGSPVEIGGYYQPDPLCSGGHAAIQELQRGPRRSPMTSGVPLR